MSVTVASAAVAEPVAGEDEGEDEGRETESAPVPVSEPEDDPESEAAAERAAALTAETRSEDGGWVALPGVSYSPDTGLNLSGAVLRYFRLPDAGRPSKVNVTAGVSARGAFEINVDPDLWLAGDDFNIAVTSKISYLERAFFGIGNATPDSQREDYTAWRFDARIELARRLPHDLFLAPIFDFRYQDIVEVEPGGAIDRGEVVGAGGGVLSAVGVELRWDTRDSIFYPTRGVKLETSPRLYHGVFGSDHDFVRLFLDASAYFNVWRDHVLALDFRADFRWGDPPFDFLSVAGGNRLLRGMLEGRVRDDHYLASQVEYRFPIYWRVGAVVFAGLGRVAPALDEFELDGWKYSVGGGLRFAVDRDEHINIRVDLGVTEYGTGAYLNFLEAF